MTASPDPFYESVRRTNRFADLADDRLYEPLPDDWIVGLSDIEDSTGFARSGAFKAVNMVGAAIVSAQLNAHPDAPFPFIFNGDGATFAMPAANRDTASQALDGVRRWAFDTFGMVLRVAIVEMRQIRQAGYDVRVLRYEPNENIDYAMFSGGGVSWAEAEMKAGRIAIPPMPGPVAPDLSGLSCRWTPMTSQNGRIVSLIVEPSPLADRETVRPLFEQVIALTERLERAGHPCAPEGPGFAWPPQGLTLEAQAGEPAKPLWRRKLGLYVETFIAYVFHRLKLKAGGFDARHYVRTAGVNSDFRKVEDRLMMTLDCDPQTMDEIRSLLAGAKAKGLINYGLVEQPAAVMTCIVPSVMSDDHIHFIDGTDGGYAAAYRRMIEN